MRNVRRWRGGKVLERWVAAAVCEASRRFRRLRGHAQMRELTVALAHPGKHTNLDTTRKAA